MQSTAKDVTVVIPLPDFTILRHLSMRRDGVRATPSAFGTSPKYDSLTLP